MSAVHGVKQSLLEGKVRSRILVELLEVKCRCGHLNVVPVYGKLVVDEPIKCEKCGKEIVKRVA